LIAPVGSNRTGYQIVIYQRPNQGAHHGPIGDPSAIADSNKPELVVFYGILKAPLSYMPEQLNHINEVCPNCGASENERDARF